MRILPWPGSPAATPGRRPCPDEPGCAFCIHQYLQTRHGIVNQENLALKQLADDGIYVFTYPYSPVPIAGATGSIGSPIAIDCRSSAAANGAAALRGAALSSSGGLRRGPR